MLTVISSVELLQAQNQKWVLSFFVFIKSNVGIDLTLKSFQDHPVYSVAVALFCTFSPSVLSLKFTAPGGSPFTHLFINLANFEWYFDVLQLFVPCILILHFSFRTSSIPRIHVPIPLWSVSLVSSCSVCWYFFSVHFYRSCLFTIDFLFSFYLRYLLYPLGLDFFFSSLWIIVYFFPYVFDLVSFP